MNSYVDADFLRQTVKDQSQNWWFRGGQGQPEKKPGFNSPPRGGLMYTPTDWEPKREIRA